MKKSLAYLLIFLFSVLMLLPLVGKSQATFTAPVGYNTGAPTATPSGVGTRWRFDLLTGKKYTWLPGTLSWDEDARGIDQVSGCSAPLYTPGYNQSTFAVNACSPPVLYQWTGAAWEIPNEPEIYTAGTGISIDGSNVISNTAPNVVQELSISGQDLTLSGGGGTVAIPSSSLWTDGGAFTYLTATGDNVAIGGTSATQKLDVTGSIKGSADLYLGSAFNIYDNGSRVWHRSGSSQSLFVGNAVGTTSNTGNRNFGFGTNIFQFLTSGEQNVAIGGTALYALTTGSANVGIGVNVMQNLTTGNSNMSIGGSSGSAITTGLGNCLIGNGAGGSITTGSYNMAIGTNSLRTATTQGYNAAIGFQALYTNNPSFSVAIGSESGYGGANRLNGLYLGAYAGKAATAATQIAIGYGAGYGNSIDQTLAIDYNPSFTSDATPLISGNFSTDRVGINTAHASLAQTLHVQGTARITGSDGTATTVMGRDADGDISALGLSGLSIVAGTLTNSNTGTPVSYDNASAPNNCIFYSTTLSKLAYKDPGGTVNPLY